MKKFFILFLFILFLTNLVSAFNFDKGKLYFNINIGENSCQMITFSETDGELFLRDVWAETFDEERNLNYYNYTAEGHSLSISYIFENPSKLNVCLEGEKVGKYKGLLIFTPEAETNVVVEKGVWLFVTITNQEQENSPETPTPTTNNGGSSGGGSSGDGGSNLKTQEPIILGEEKTSININVNQEINEKTEEEEEKEVESSVGITGAVIGGVKQSWKIIAITLVVIAIAGLVIYNKRKTDEVQI